ncbi:hypothetical protein E8E11_005376 [Didymella keratinophila]|nr:hypothetical protein E8E11_005376 [Didymella keratinophila]
MPSHPHDIEFKGEMSSLPENAYSIQKLTDELVSSYAHHGFLFMTVTLLIFFIATRGLHDYLFPWFYKETWKKYPRRRSVPSPTTVS